METTRPTMVQVCDKIVDREYYKTHNGFLWSWQELLRTDRISSDLQIRVDIDRPFTVIINGEEYVKKELLTNKQII